MESIKERTGGVNEASIKALIGAEERGVNRTDDEEDSDELEEEEEGSDELEEEEEGGDKSEGSDMDIDELSEGMEM
ncbi:hypothetical protein niasHT_000067 [Heterodera trifolii]|uniref:Uncharacterized protein n=1 Tax=Heterodera trifolii TaxID=157864 RepID=A0ABD2M4P6_9BILA